jgi:protein gp37
MGLEAYTDEIRQNKGMKHVWLGVSAENQECLVERWAHLKDTPAAVRWISAEPLLGPLDFGEPAEIGTWPNHGRMFRNEKEWDDWKYWAAAAIDWVVIGGESRQSMEARPCELEWLRSIKNQCLKHKVPVWMKQMGQCVLFSGSSSPGEHWPHTFVKESSLKRRLQTTHVLASGSYGWRVHLHDEHGADPKEWPEDMRVQQLPKVA